MSDLQSSIARNDTWISKHMCQQHVDILQQINAGQLKTKRITEQKHSCGSWVVSSAIAMGMQQLVTDRSSYSSI